MSISDLAYASLEQALNRYIALDPEARQRLAQLHGRVIGIEVLGTGVRLYLIPGPARLQLLSCYEGEPECLLRGTPLALAGLKTGGSGAHGAELILTGAVEFQGDTELGHRFGAILAGLDIDWEQRLSRLTGDALAHEIGNGVRALTGWGRHVGGVLSDELRYCLQEQARLLPERADIDAYVKEVDSCRDDVERLQARVERLLHSAAKPEGTAR